jgi:NADH:flavin oxidoreductase / NADH oxidase family
LVNTGRKLFTPLQLGAVTLKHRVVMAPLTRSRSMQPGDIPGDLMAEYYTQRTSEGGFIISEATSISITGRGWLGAPGLYSEQQVAGWSKITSAVHAKGSRMFSQLWHTGRSSHVEMTDGPMPVSASVNPSIGRILHTSSPPPPAGSHHRRIARSISRRFPASSMTTGKPPRARKRPVSTASNCTAPTAICRTSSCRTAATSARIPTAVRSKTVRASCWRSWRRWCRSGEAIA